MAEEIVNRVTQSGLITLDLADYYPSQDNCLEFDIKNYLWEGIALKEKDFRESLKDFNWEAYKDKNVALNCSVDAVIPSWAYMLVASYLEPVAKMVIYGSQEELNNFLLIETINKLDTKEFQEARIIIKGCGELPISPSAYTAITIKLKPIVKSLMFGEACSSVPVYKQPRKKN